MKKLMIAAATAAMIGGAFAAGYDFTASVKTTKGAQGKQTTTYKVNLGQDADGNYWWKGDYDTAAEGKKALAKMTNDEKAEFAEYIEFGDSKWDDNPLNLGKNEFGVPELYKGRAIWCASFTFKVNDADCYRVAASRKFKGIVQIDACCGTWEFLYDESVAKDLNMAEFLGDADDDVEIDNKLLYRFGGVLIGKATKVEYVGAINDLSAPGDWAFAGQGCWDAKLDIVKNISGNIVGILPNPDCENCCDDDQVAIVFECDDWDKQEDPNGTAAFGTWSIKYNKKY